jgi:hypothetical protein
MVALANHYIITLTHHHICSLFLQRWGCLGGESLPYKQTHNNPMPQYIITALLRSIFYFRCY